MQRAQNLDSKDLGLKRLSVKNDRASKRGVWQKGTLELVALSERIQHAKHRRKQMYPLLFGVFGLSLFRVLVF